MTKERLLVIAGISDALCKSAGKELFWKTLKGYYLTLTDDEEKNKILSMLFKDKEKEG